MLVRLASHARRNAVGYLALFVALGGTSYAAANLPKNSVGTKQLKNGAVKAKKVAPHSLTGKQINAGTLGTVRNASNAAHFDSRLPSAFEPRARWALVDSDGTIIQQSGGITIKPAGITGQWYVNFGTDITSKLILLSASSTAHQSLLQNTQGVASACGHAQNSKLVQCDVSVPHDGHTVYVATFKYDGTEVAGAFYVAAVD